MAAIIGKAYLAGHEAALEKLAGGPGSGVKGYNTATLSMPKSKHVSVGTRKALLENMPYEEAMVPVAAVTNVAQDKYVPKKVQGLMRNPEAITKKPIDVLVAHDEVTIIDGHHRYLAAKQQGVEHLPARVYLKRNPDGSAPKIPTAEHE